MTSSSTSSNSLPNDETIWESLKQAIASSSGFQRWQIERGGDEPQSDEYPGDGHISTLPLDQRVRRYLRETLETLAY
ncbi:MAG: hypothetical protein Fur0046_16370 [Cyanobacteria bacterium J069]|nr:MAG: hypothetical protein D6742_03790 [Cyanobacteria bacterium J069]